MHKYSLFVGIALIALSVDASAQTESTVNDPNAKLSFKVSHEYPWESSTELESDTNDTTSCAVSPAEVEPMATICVKIILKPNSLRLKVPSLGVAHQKFFLRGVCSSYQCDSSSKPGDADEFIESTYGDLSGYELVTEVKHPGYVDANLEDSIFFVSLSPTGQMQLFSLHTASGQAEKYRSVFEAAVASTQYLAD